MARAPATVVPGVIGCLMAVVSVPAVWAEAEVLDTERYVARRPVGLRPGRRRRRAGTGLLDPLAAPVRQASWALVVGGLVAARWVSTPI